MARWSIGPQKAGQRGSKRSQTALHQALLSNRMMLGVFFGQYFINTTPGSSSPGSRFIWCRKKACRSESGSGRLDSSTVWFCGRRAGGVFSDYLIKRGLSLTLARSYRLCWECCWLPPSSYVTTPQHHAGGHADGAGFLWQRIWWLGWPVISDTAPKEIVGLCGASLTSLAMLPPLSLHW